MLPKIGYRRNIVILIYFAAAVAAIAFFYKYLIYTVMPFALGWLIADMIQDPMNTLKSRVNLSKKISGIFFVILIVFLIIAFVTLIAGGLYSCLTRIYGYFSENGKGISDSLEELLNKAGAVFDKLNFSGINARELKEKASGEMLGLVSGLVGMIPDILGAIASFAPKCMIFIILLIISAYYFACDFDSINTFVVGLFSRKNRPLIFEIKNQAVFTLRQLLKSYFVLAVICFSELYLGFTVLGLRYAFDTALLVAAIDALPILGVGTVLIPWTVFSFVSGDTKRAIILIAIYGVITFVRQLAEPRLVGSLTGIHPILSLFSLFLGLRLMGVFGMFFIPISVIIIKNLYIKGYIKTAGQ